MRPQVLTYRGGDIRLGNGVVIRARENPQLAGTGGKRIVTTDGTTLLGADDKAGIAVIMALAEGLLRDPSIPHGEVRIAFTPDEEVGNGTRYLDLEAFGADVAYTLDGGRARRAEQGDLQRRRRHHHGPRPEHPPGHRQGRDGQCAARAGRRHRAAAARHGAGDDRGARALHPPAPRRGRGGAGHAAASPPRLRDPGAGAAAAHPGADRAPGAASSTPAPASSWR